MHKFFIHKMQITCKRKTYLIQSKAIVTYEGVKSSIILWCSCVESLATQQRINLQKDAGWSRNYLHVVLCSVLTCAFAPCGWMLASGDSGGELIIWDIHAGNPLHCKTIHDMGINCLLFLTTRDPGQGQHTMISAGSDCIITIWNISSNASKHDI